MPTHKIPWIADANGLATFEFGGKDAPPLIGVMDHLLTKPGTPTPTANWDVTLEDELGFDVLLRAGEDRSATETQDVPIAEEDTTYHMVSPATGVLTLHIRNAGANTTGLVILFVRN